MSKRHKPPKTPKSKVGHRRKIAILSDTHGDVYKPGLNRMLAEKPDLTLLVGDAMDCFSLSRFTKSKDIPLETELANTRGMFVMITSVCPLKVAMGNHDRRFLIYLSNRIDSKYIKHLNMDLLTLSANGLDGVEIVEDAQSFTTPGGERFNGAMSTSFMITRSRPKAFPGPTISRLLRQVMPRPDFPQARRSPPYPALRPTREALTRESRK